MKTAMAAPAPAELREYYSYSAEPKPKAGRGGALTGSLTQKKEAPLSVKIGKIIASGGLSKETMEKVIKKHVQEINNCLANNALSATVKIKLIIQADGTVKTASISASDLKNAAIEQCITQSMKAWAFPFSSQETMATITLVFGS